CGSPNLLASASWFGSELSSSTVSGGDRIHSRSIAKSVSPGFRNVVDIVVSPVVASVVAHHQRLARIGLYSRTSRIRVHLSRRVERGMDSRRKYCYKQGRLEFSGQSMAPSRA